LPTYRVFGLNIFSSFILPELLSKKGPADAKIRLGKPVWPLGSPKNRWFKTPAGNFYFFSKTRGHFAVSEGKEIVAWPATGSDEGMLRSFLLGPCLAFLLSQRGRVVLHASAVQSHNRAFLFLGKSGDGQSTLAGAFKNRNYEIIADDLAVLEFTPRGCRIYPGFPQIKLHPDSASVLGYNFKTLERIEGYSKKGIKSFSKKYSKDSFPVRCIYLLDPSTKNGIKSVSLQEAHLEILGHSYLNLAAESLVDKAYFHQSARLVNSVTIKRLTRSCHFQLDDLINRVEADA
jgi:hypothetical protein